MTTTVQHFGDAEASVCQHMAGLSLESEPCSLLDFLQVMQQNNVYYLPISPQAGLGIVGRGLSGVVNQAAADVATTLTFKNGVPSHRIRDDEEYRDWYSLMTEISILEHPPVKQNPYIINLVGISWKIDPKRLRAWPYIVTTKATGGNLANFLLQDDIDDKTRLQIFAELTEAFAVLHRSGVGHGDIKPENILLDEDEKGNFRCRVADFGSSAVCGQTRIPKGTPLWHAPELPIGQKCTVTGEAIIASDLYSYGLLMAHVLIPKKCLINISLFLLQPDESTESKLRELYEIGSLASDLASAATNGNIPKFHQTLLAKLLSGTFNTDAGNRVFEWNAVEPLFERHDLLSGPGKISMDAQQIKPNGRILGHCDHSIFDIALSLGELDDVDYILRHNIADDILSKASKGSCAECSRLYASQLSICYSIGFGFRRDAIQCQSWQKIANLTDKNLQEKIDCLSTAYKLTGRLTEQVREALAIGVLVTSDRVEQYKLQGRLKNAEISLCDAVSARESVFGPFHITNSKLKSELAQVYQGQSNLAEAVKYQREVITTCENLLGPNHPSTLSANASLAYILSDEGLLLEAEAIQRRIQPKLEAVLGEQHPDTVTALQNLGVTLNTQNRYQEAADIFRDVSRLRTNSLSRTHPLTIRTDICLAVALQGQGLFRDADGIMTDVANRSKEAGDIIIETYVRMNQATMYRDQERLEDAERSALSAVKMLQKKLNPDDPMRIQAQEVLSLVYAAQERFDEQESLLRTILKLKAPPDGMNQPILAMKTYLSSNLFKQHRIEESMIEAQQVVQALKDSPGMYPEHYMACINTITSCMLQGGRRDEAESMQQSLLFSYEKVLGHYHPLTLDARSSLSAFYFDIGRFERSAVLQKKNLDALLESKQRGKGLARYAQELASTYREQSKFVEAVELCNKAKAWSIESVGKSHMDTLSIENSLASIYYDMGHPDEAVEICTSILQTEGLTARLEMSVRENLSSIRKGQGQFTEAENLAIEALALSSRKYGDNHSATIKLVGTILAYRLSRQLTEELEAMALENIRVKQSILGPQHFSTIKSMCALANAYNEHGRLEEAEAMYEEMERMDIKTVLQNQARYAIYCAQYAHVCFQRGLYEQSQELEEKALLIRQNILPADHRAIQTSKRNLASSLTAQGKYVEAEELIKAVVVTRERVLEPDAVATLQTKCDLAGIYFFQKRYDESEELYEYLLKAYQAQSASPAVLRLHINSIQKVKETREADHRSRQA